VEQNKIKVKQTIKFIKMESSEIYTQMATLWAKFSEEHDKTSKAAHGRARKHLGDMKKLVTEYRKASIAEDKK
jgi:hypothetical protein